MLRFEGKVALVTGGSRGIGFAIAQRFSNEGCAIALLSTNQEGADAAAQKIGGVKTIGYECNVADADAVQSVVDRILTEFGKIDILVNNAGITRDNLLMRMSSDQWDDVMNVNLKGTFNMSKAVVRAMMKARYGKIVNVASIVGLSGNAGQSNYAASKAGIIGFTKSLAKEIASRHITVNAVAPGFIETDMSRAISPEMKETYIKAIPLGREGSPEDIASAVAFLASEEASYITGHIIQVDGGLYI